MSNNEQVTALDRRTLQAKWRFAESGLVPQLLWDERFLLLGGGGSVALLDVRERRVVWRIKGWSFAAWRGLLLVEGPGSVKVIAPETGDTVESIPLDGDLWLFASDLIVAGIQGNDGVLRAIGVEDRRVRWERNIFKELSGGFSVRDAQPFNPVLGSLGDRFIATGGRGEAAFVIAVSLRDGSVLWRADVHCDYYRPLVADGRIPVLSRGQRFVVLDEATGVLLHDRVLDLGAITYVQPGVILGDHVMFTSESGHVLVFDLLTGDLAGLGNYGVRMQGAVVADERILVAIADGSLWEFAKAKPTLTSK